MRTMIRVALACWVVGLAQSPSAVAQDAKPDRHNWDEIIYPLPPTPTPTSLVPGFVLRNGKDRGLTFVVWYGFREDDEAQKKIPPLDKTSVRLHTMDGQIAVSKPRGPLFIGSLGMVEYSYEHRFAWRQNVLEEAWIEVRLPQQTFWIEVPYGFTCNPADPLTLSEARRGPPKLPPTVKPGVNDWLVPWTIVKYWKLVPTRKDWDLSLYISNSFSPDFDVILYRDDFKEGKQEHPWKLASPQTEMEIKLSKDRTLAFNRMGVRLHSDQMRRTDSFELAKSYGGNERSWGTIVVNVDRKSNSCVVPSSLFWGGHGATDLGERYKAQVPRRRER